MNNQQGYYRFPTVFGDRVVFVSEDDLWSVSLTGGEAIRLTANVGGVSCPHFSEDGKQIAFNGREEGSTEVYVMDYPSGIGKRLTFFGHNCEVLGWNEGKIIFSSSHKQPFRQNTMLFAISPEDGTIDELPYGLASSISFGKKGVVIGRKASDLARWKRYKGGTAGEIWIDKDGKGEFKRILNMKGNFANPLWIGERIYFLSDYEGIANIYSANKMGKDLKKHTDHKDFYVRNATTDGESIVYHAGADLYRYDIALNETRKIEIVYHSPFIQRNRKFVSAERFTSDVDLNGDGSRMVLLSRGKIFNMADWEGGVVQCGKQDGIRYRLTGWLNDNKRIVTVSDEGGEEHLEVFDAENNSLLKKILFKESFRFLDISVSPAKGIDAIACINHRNELSIIDLKSEKKTEIDRNLFGPIDRASWSPDGKWLAYSKDINRSQRAIMLYSLSEQKSYQISKPVLMDEDPCFSQDGKYIYLISSRIFNPVYDSLHFDLGFPTGYLPYAITLSKDDKHPFDLESKGFNNDSQNSDKKDNKKRKGKKDETDIEVRVDIEGIEERLTPLPVKEGLYYHLETAGKRVFYLSLPVSGSLDEDNMLDQQPKAALKYYDLEKKKENTLFSGVSHYTLSRDGSALLVKLGKKVRIVSSKIEPEAISKEQGFSRETGWVNLNRIKISVNPQSEWRQMYREAWSLQKDFFWVEDMSGIDWQKVYERYLPLLDRLSSRAEFADLVWEMQGELGTSHAYEFGGDYRQSPFYASGKLGADFEYNPKKNGYEIKHIVKGDSWSQKFPPSLAKPGLNITEGMILKAINGYQLDQSNSPERVLVNFANQEVQITIADKTGKNERNVTVKTLSNEQPLRYREWVEQNKEYVHKKSKGKVGYIHIPDMMGQGYSEFHRHFLSEFDYDGLIVDVRYNGGGHVSQLILEKLARKRIGYDLTRWFGYEPYPSLSVKGPIVALTNEFAGSDGDIFSHSFKLMNLGKLIGKRTWGGVIGISPRFGLVDGGLTTQPEFSFWFKDVGWSVENYGTDPDIEVEMRPMDYRDKSDPQLDRALDEVKKEMKSHKYLKLDVDNRPKLPLP